MHFSSRLLAAAGARAHPARQDPGQPGHDPGQAAVARRPARRRRARAAAAVIAIAVPLLAGAAPALAASSGTAGAAPTSTGHVYWGNADPSGLGATIGRANLQGGMVNQNFITAATQPGV